MTATLWLNVIDSPENSTSIGQLWTVTRKFDHAPLVGEDVILWPGEDYDPDEGPTWPVRRRYWNAHGHLNLELARMVVDPTEAYLGSYERRRMTSLDGSGLFQERTWSTSYDPSPELGLVRGRWTRYGA